MLQSGLDERWWSDSKECCCFVRNVQDLLADGKTTFERRFGEPFKGPITPLWSNGWMSSDLNARWIKTSSIWQESITWYLSWLWADREKDLEKDILIADLEDLEKLDASEIYPQRINAKDKTKTRWIHFPDSKLYSKIVRERLRITRTHSKAGTDRGVKVWAENFKVNPESLNRQNQQMTLKPVPTSGRSKVTSSIIVTMNLEFNSVPKEETFPIPLKHIDLAKSTHTDLDVMQEKRIDDCWNVDSNRNLSVHGKVSRSLLYWKKNLPKDLWSGGRLTTIQPTSRPDHVWPEVWTKIGKAAQNREKQEGTKEKAKLDNARRPRGIYFIDPDYQEYKVTHKNAKRKLERPVAPALPCKRKAPNGITKVCARAEIASEKNPKTIYGWIVESHEWQGNDWNLLSLKIMKTTLQAKDLLRCSSVFPIPQAMKIPDATAAVDKEWKKLETIPAWQLEKVKSKEEVILEAQRDSKKVHFATLTLVISRMRSQNQNYKNTKAESCSEGTL